jgi:hypothetical protein
MIRTTLLVTLCLVVIAAAGCDTKSQPTTKPAAMVLPGPNAADVYRAAWTKMDSNLQGAAAFVVFDASGMRLIQGDQFSRVEDVNVVLKSGQPVIEELMKAGAMASCDFQLRFDAKHPEARMPEILDVTGSMRKAARILRADAARAWTDGDMDGATERVAALYQMAAHAADEPVLVMSLTNSAVILLANETARTMATGAGGKTLSADQRARLVAVIDRLDRNDPAGMVRARNVDKPNDAAAEQSMDQTQLKLTSDLATTRRALGGTEDVTRRGRGS